jgi:hypothetical protein
MGSTALFSQKRYILTYFSGHMFIEEGTLALFIRSHPPTEADL